MMFTIGSVLFLLTKRRIITITKKKQMTVLCSRDDDGFQPVCQPVQILF
jgi:hypothetical protein